MLGYFVLTHELYPKFHEDHANVVLFSFRLIDRNLFCNLKPEMKLEVRILKILKMNFVLFYMDFKIC